MRALSVHVFGHDALDLAHLPPTRVFHPSKVMDTRRGICHIQIVQPLGQGASRWSLCTLTQPPPAEHRRWEARTAQAGNGPPAPPVAAGGHPFSHVTASPRRLPQGRSQGGACRRDPPGGSNTEDPETARETEKQGRRLVTPPRRPPPQISRPIAESTASTRPPTSRTSDQVQTLTPRADDYRSTTAELTWENYRTGAVRQDSRRGRRPYRAAALHNTREFSGGFSEHPPRRSTGHEGHPAERLKPPHFSGELTAQVLGLGNSQPAPVTVLLHPRQTSRQSPPRILARHRADLPK